MKTDNLGSPERTKRKKRKLACQEKKENGRGITGRIMKQDGNTGQAGCLLEMSNEKDKKMSEV